MESKPMLPKQVDVSRLTFGTPKALDNGGKSIYVGYEGQPLFIQTPEMGAPFGMSKWGADKGDKVADKCTLELSFKGRETNKSMAAFYDKLNDMDKHFIQAAMENSTAWLKKKYNTTEVVEALYTHMVKHAKDKETGEITDKYPPNFRITIPQKDGKITCPVYNKSKEQIDISDIEKGSKVTAIIQCLGIWVAGGKFGCSWKVVQLLVVPPASFKGFAFMDVEGDGAAKSEDNSDLDECADNAGDIPEPDHDDDHHTRDHEMHDESPKAQTAANEEDDIIESSSDEEDAIEAPRKKAAPVKKVVKKSAK